MPSSCNRRLTWLWPACTGFCERIGAAQASAAAQCLSRVKVGRLGDGTPTHAVSGPGGKANYVHTNTSGWGTQMYDRLCAYGEKCWRSEVITAGSADITSWQCSCSATLGMPADSSAREQEITSRSSWLTL